MFKDDRELERRRGLYFADVCVSTLNGADHFDIGREGRQLGPCMAGIASAWDLALRIREGKAKRARDNTDLRDHFRFNHLTY